MKEFMERLQSEIEQLNSTNDAFLRDINQPSLLKTRLLKLNERHAFAPGDIIRWKPGLKNRRYPAADGVAIVVQVLRVPIFYPGEDAGGDSFREPLDLIFGYVTSDDRFCCFHADSRRFEPAAPARQEPAP